MIVDIDSEADMQKFGLRLGGLLAGGEVIELVGDIGAGKTYLTKSIAKGLGIVGEVQSPTFTINRTYATPRGLQLNHYDFYRLDDAGIMAMELAEALGEAGTVIIIEWGGVVGGVLPDDRLTIRIKSITETSRSLNLYAGGVLSRHLLEKLQ